MTRRLVAHLQQHTTRTYGRYALIAFQNGHSCTALVDSGNEWRTAISAGTAERLGLRLRPLDNGRTAIGTAKEGSTLTVLGEMKTPLVFQFAECPTAGRFHSPLFWRG